MPIFFSCVAPQHRTNNTFVRLKILLCIHNDWQTHHLITVTFSHKSHWAFSKSHSDKWNKGYQTKPKPAPSVTFQVRKKFIGTDFFKIIPMLLFAGCQHSKHLVYQRKYYSEFSCCRITSTILLEDERQPESVVLFQRIVLCLVQK